jgi:hypothetical protein
VEEGIPGQVEFAVLKTGVTEIVAVSTVVPEFVALKDAMELTPSEAVKPIDVFVFVQV